MPSQERDESSVIPNQEMDESFSESSQISENESSVQ